MPAAKSILRLRKAYSTSGRNAQIKYSYPPRSIDVDNHDLEQPKDTVVSRSLHLDHTMGPDCLSVHTGRIVISEKGVHDKELCEAPKSWGPDFASTLKGKFCDMGTRRLWDILSDKITV